MLYWNELTTHDAERSKKLYSDSIGWTMRVVPSLA